VSPRALRLWVMWAEPKERRRRRIGELWRDSQGYAFAYGHDLLLAQSEGFRLLPEFPQQQPPEAPYRSRYLFATFAQRIPSPKRPDFDAIMASWGVLNADDPLEVLAASGGVQMTDRIELAEHRAADDDLSSPLFIRVAGTRYYPAAEHVQTNMKLQLSREPANSEDEDATMICTADGGQIGYVPKQYSQLVARHIDSGHTLSAVAVRWLEVPGTARYLTVRVAKT
jgi:hypothetical protein